MPLEMVDLLNELRQRLDRLERATRRGSRNQKQAAEYLNRSEEWLRREHVRMIEGVVTCTATIEGPVVAPRCCA